MVQEFKSARTSINSKKVPALFRKIIWALSSVNLDLGGGKYDTATDWLKKFGVRNLIYDPFNRDAAHNEAIARELDETPADTATLSNVLCVIKEPEIRHELLKTAKKWARVTYIKVYEGDRSGVGRVTQRGCCWQENRRLDDYLPEVKAVFTNVEKRGDIIVAW